MPFRKELFFQPPFFEQSIELGENCSSIGPNSTLTWSPEDKKNFVALFLFFIPVVTVFGNLLVVISVFRERTLRTATNYLIISLATSDLLVALCVMPFAVYVEVENGLWRLPKSLCICYTAIDVMASTASILNLVAISWDRFMAVSRPIEYSQSKSRKNRRVFVMIAAVWSISLMIALPMVTGLNRLDDTQYCEFTNGVYIIASSFASFFLPCLIMVALYSVVLKKLRQRQEQRNRSNKNSRFLSKRRRSTKNGAFSYHNESTSNNEVSFGLSTCPNTNNDRPKILTSPIRRQQNPRENDSFLENDFLTVQSPRLTSSPFLVPSPTNSCCRGDLAMSKYKTHEKSDENWTNNNNIIMTIATVGLSDQRSNSPLIYSNFQPKLNVAAFDLSEIDGESVPFIDSSSVQATPLRKPQHGPRCSGTLTSDPVPDSALLTYCLRAGPFSKFTDKSSSSLGNSILINKNANSISTTTSSKRLVEDFNFEFHLPTLRRHSAASCENSTAAMRFRDRTCFSEIVELYRKRLGTGTKTISNSKYSRQSRKERRATHTLAVVLVVFLCCWLPFFTCHITNSVCKLRSNETCINIAAFFFTTWIGYTNSFMNPIIYTIFNPEYRRAFKNILCCRSTGRR